MEQNKINLLIKAGEISTKEYAKMLKELTIRAQAASSAVAQISSADVYDIGMTDKLERLKRNCLSFSNILSIVSDFPGCINEEINEILKAHYAAEEQKELERKTIVEREAALANAERQKRHRERVKKNADKQ